MKTPLLGIYGVEWKDMEKKFGPEAAAAVLSRLGKLERDKILLYIDKEDPDMGQALRQMMVTLDDLQFITVSMLQELLRLIKIDDLALALRLAKDETREFIFENVSRSLRQDILDVYKGPPLPLSKVQEAYERIMQVVRKRVEEGTIIIDRDGSQYV